MKRPCLLCLSWILLVTCPLLARAELVIIVNKENPATKMYLNQVSQFYLGVSNIFAPVELVEGNPLKAEFYKKVLEKEPAQVQAVWAKLTFTGKAKPPREFKSVAEVRKYIAETPNAIGYIDKASADDTVKIIANVQ